MKNRVYRVIVLTVISLQSVAIATLKGDEVDVASEKVLTKFKELLEKGGHFEEGDPHFKAYKKLKDDPKGQKALKVDLTKRFEKSKDPKKTLSTLFARMAKDYAPSKIDSSDAAISEALVSVETGKESEIRFPYPICVYFNNCDDD